MIPITCPNCHKQFDIPINKIEEAKGATMDCVHCNSLLLCRAKDLAIVDFHAQMHCDNPGMWPKDGKDTFSIDI